MLLYIPAILYVDLYIALYTQYTPYTCVTMANRTVTSMFNILLSFAALPFRAFECQPKLKCSVCIDYMWREPTHFPLFIIRSIQKLRNINIH